MCGKEDGREDNGKMKDEGRDVVYNGKNNTRCCYKALTNISRASPCNALLHNLHGASLITSDFLQGYLS